MKARHSVRSFTNERIDDETKAALLQEIAACNAESGLHLQLITDEPKAFDGMLARYSKFKNCRNYLAIAGVSGADEAVGYYGERVVLAAQALGLNSCWVAVTYSKGRVPCRLEEGEKLHIVIALGYGTTQGSPHKSKRLEAVCEVDDATPDWFKAGVEAALLAPTAMNQQRFHFSLVGEEVRATAGVGLYTAIDLGIAKYHFEAIAGEDNVRWA